MSPVFVDLLLLLRMFTVCSQFLRAVFLLSNVPYERSVVYRTYSEFSG